MALALAPRGSEAEPLLRLAAIDSGPHPSETLANAEAPVALRAAASEVGAATRFDPLLVYYPGRACETGVLEVQRWNRAAQRWSPHPDHPRIRGDSCRVEDAGGLLNEIRVRCVDPTGQRWSSSWRVGAELWQPPDESPCPIGGVREDRPAPLSVSVESPPRGAVLRDREPLARIEGRARVGEPGGGRHEILLAIDASDPQAGDIAPRLPAQVQAARRFLASLRESLGPVRVGILSYAGASAGSPARARVEVPLSTELARLEAGLAAIAPGGPDHDESFPAVVELGVRELRGGPGAQSTPRLDARRLLLVLSDGRPALPFGEGDRSRNAFERSIRAARGAHRAGIALHLFALGGDATPFSPLAYRMLDRTPGSFQRIVDPERDDWLARFSFARVSKVFVENLTTNAMAEDVALGPDGSFSGHLPVTGGPNRVRVTALASDGREQSVEVELRFERERSAAERALDAERERMRRVRAEQRRHLDLEVEPLPKAPSGE